MADEGAPKAAGQPRARTVETVEDSTTVGLDEEQEQVVRMRYGFALPDNEPLPTKAEGHSELMEKLRAIEREAFEKSGRFAEMAKEAGVDLDDPARVEGQAVKRKIIDRLKGSTTD